MEEKLKKNSASNYYYYKKKKEAEQANNAQKINIKTKISNENREKNSETEIKERNERYQSIFFKTMIQI